MIYIDNKLSINNNLILDLINETPLHLYDKNHIIKQYNILKNGSDNLICYAVKANFNSDIIKTIVELGGGFDCVSEGEIKHVIDCGAKKENIIFSGIGKTTEELQFAIKTGIKYISCESLEEIDEIIEISNNLKIKTDICLRVNLNIKAKTHKYISTGSNTDKFGIDNNKIKDICEKIKNLQFVNLVGLAIHIGSQILDWTNFEIAFNSFIPIIKSVNIKTVSIGGGLGIAYKPEDTELEKISTHKYLEIVDNFQKQINLPLILEPGRFLVGNAGIILAKVVRVKKTDNINFLILNVGMNNIIRPALYQAYHHILPVIKNDNLPKEKYKIVGPVCESADVFHDEYEMQAMKKNDLVAILSTGAYCRSMASNYNLMKIASEIFLFD